MALELTQPLKEMSTRNISWGYRWPVRWADNPNTFKCRLSINLWASTSWNPKGLSRHIMGLLYLYLAAKRHHGSLLKCVLSDHSSTRSVLPAFYQTVSSDLDIQKVTTNEVTI
jgi:hypothetical protein